MLDTKSISLVFAFKECLQFLTLNLTIGYLFESVYTDSPIDSGLKLPLNDKLRHVIIFSGLPSLHKK